MLPITMIITDAGLDALVDAEDGDTDPIVITEVGLSHLEVTPAPTVVALAGEFKRLDAISGQSVAPNIIHMTAQDPSVDIYDLRSIALYLADGTLFAVYGQADPLFSKVSIATFLLALDLAFSADLAGAIEFGNADFLYPPATEIEKGVAEIATQAEVNAEADDTRIVTPLKLGVRLAALLGVINASLAAVVARTITGGGLATGGGSLAADRVITVTAASLAETNAGAIGNKAVVPSGLATIIANIAALLARTITGGGLVTGGGSLAADRVLTVTAATGADIATGTDNTKAVTPAAIAGTTQSFGTSVLGLGGALIKMGTVTLGFPGGTSSAGVTFPVAFPNACNRVLLTPQGDIDGGDDHDETWWVSAMSASGITVGMNGDLPGSVTFAWVAFGH